MIQESSGGKERRILKATLEAVFQSQERLRKHLDVLIEQNRPLADDAERDLFFRELCFSTLGLGTEQRFCITVTPCKGVEDWGNIEYQARCLGRLKTDHMVVKRELKSGAGEVDVKVPISQLWDILLQGLLNTFATSLDRATGLSREQDSSGKSIGYMISDD